MLISFLFSLGGKGIRKRKTDLYIPFYKSKYYRHKIHKVYEQQKWKTFVIQTDMFQPGSHAFFLVCNTMLALSCLIISDDISDYRN